MKLLNLIACSFIAMQLYIPAHASDLDDALGIIDCYSTIEERGCLHIYRTYCAGLVVLTSHVSYCSNEPCIPNPELNLKGTLPLKRPRLAQHATEMTKLKGSVPFSALRRS